MDSDWMSEHPVGILVFLFISFWTCRRRCLILISNLLGYQEIHSNLVSVISSGSILPCSLKTCNFITAARVPRGAVLDPLLFLYTKLLDEGWDLRASTASMSMAHKFISLFPPSGHPPGFWKILSLSQPSAKCLNMKGGLGGRLLLANWELNLFYNLSWECFLKNSQQSIYQLQTTQKA